jgi:hypothetical protein
MIQTVDATYDGLVIHLSEPLDLAPNTPVRVTIEANPPVKGFFETAMALNLDGPPDWSERLEEYLYGEPSTD